MFIKNKISTLQIDNLINSIKSFNKQSKLNYPESKFVSNTLSLIDLGIKQKIPNHLWFDSDTNSYCMCKLDIDSDGELIYIAYQLWLSPEKRSLKEVKKIINFFKFYCQKEKIKRLFITSSRIDKINAYSRGLGKEFKENYRIFKYEVN